MADVYGVGLTIRAHGWRAYRLAACRQATTGLLRLSSVYYTERLWISLTRPITSAKRKRRTLGGKPRGETVRFPRRRERLRNTKSFFALHGLKERRIPHSASDIIRTPGFPSPRARRDVANASEINIDAICLRSIARTRDRGSSLRAAWRGQERTRWKTIPGRLYLFNIEARFTMCHSRLGYVMYMYRYIKAWI